MKNEKQVEYRRIGIILYKKNRRAKNLSIRINNHGEVRVTVPGWASYARAEKFVFQKHDWILSKLSYIERRSEEKLAWRPGDSLYFLSGKVEFVAGNKAEPSILELQDGYLLELPHVNSGLQVERDKRVLEAVANIGLIEARKHLPRMMEQFSECCGIAYTKLTVKRMRSRWGSCSSKDNISLNSALIFLDEELIEYVCYHELVHILQKNHSQAFWDSLEQIHPNAKMNRKKLRNQAILA